MNKSWKDLKKQGLTGVVVRVLSRDGMDGLTMDAVAEEAGVAKGTLYAYFKNKQDLIKEAIEAIVVPMMEELMGVLKSNLTPDRRLADMTLRHLTYLEKHRDFLRVFIHDRLAAQQRWKRYRNCHYQQLLEAAAEVLKQGMDSGLFRTMDCRKVAAMIYEADVAIITQRLLSEQPGPVEPDAALITDIFLRGILRTS